MSVKTLFQPGTLFIALATDNSSPLIYAKGRQTAVVVFIYLRGITYINQFGSVVYAPEVKNLLSAWEVIHLPIIE